MGIIKLKEPISELATAKAKRNGLRQERDKLIGRRDELLKVHDARDAAEEALRALGIERETAIANWLNGLDISDRPRVDPVEYQRLTAAFEDARRAAATADEHLLGVRSDLDDIADQTKTVDAEIEILAALEYSNTVLAEKIAKYAKLRAEADTAGAELRTIIGMFCRSAPDPHNPPVVSKFEFLADHASNALSAPVRLWESDVVSPGALTAKIMAEMAALRE
jgi:hypothetical protein